MIQKSMLTTGLVLSTLWLAGCGSSSNALTTDAAKAEPLSDEAKAAYQAQLDSAEDAERALQSREKPAQTARQKAKAADDAERAAQSR